MNRGKERFRNVENLEYFGTDSFSKYEQNVLCILVIGC